MKLLSFICTSLLLFSFPVHSQTGFFSPQKPKAPTQGQIDEAFALYDECRASDMMRKYYNCDCLAENFLLSRAARPDETQDTLVFAARKKCANMVDIAGASYQRCLDWAPELRSDYEAYCTCYANSFAKNFSKTPTDSIKGREIIMTRALNSCNSGTEITEQRARQTLIERLKQQGVYGTLFPNAKTDSSQAPAETPN